MDWDSIDRFEGILAGVFLFASILFFILVATSDNGLLILLPLLIQIGVGIVWSVRYLNNRKP